MSDAAYKLCNDQYPMDLLAIKPIISQIYRVMIDLLIFNQAKTLLDCKNTSCCVCNAILRYINRFLIASHCHAQEKQ